MNALHRNIANASSLWFADLSLQRIHAGENTIGHPKNGRCCERRHKWYLKVIKFLNFEVYFRFVNNWFLSRLHYCCDIK